jgi:hypothetical protein
LLRDLVQHTPDNHEDFASLEKAYLDVKAVSTHINEAKRKREEFEELHQHLWEKKKHVTPSMCNECNKLIWGEFACGGFLTLFEFSRC